MKLPKVAKEIARFRCGSNPMSVTSVDFYEHEGKIIRHTWAMGGESVDFVKAVPDEIEGYKRIK